MLKTDYENLKKNKEEKEGKQIVTLDQKCIILLEFVKLC